MSAGAELPELERRVAAVRAGIADAAAVASRDPASIALIAVTKFHPASLVRALAGLGIQDVGESRHQEAQAKAAELADLGLRWHFVGQLQTKKARQVRRYAAAVHSVDRPALAEALASAESPLDIFVQVNLTEDPGRGGVPPAGLEPLVEQVLGTPGLVLRGLMAVAPLGDDPSAAFARVRGLAERHVLPLRPEARALSMGMSHDYREAIAEGATHLRVGTAITGNRPVAG